MAFVSKSHDADKRALGRGDIRRDQFGDLLFVNLAVTLAFTRVVNEGKVAADVAALLGTLGWKRKCFA